MKRIALFADGTWSKPDQNDGKAPTPTNVVKLSVAVAAQDAYGVGQVVFYQKGLGEQGGLWDKLTGGAFGMGISANIRGLYLFLVQNYAPGDQIFLFGYSRGAYTVRSVAGLIRNCGILRPQHVDPMDALGIPVTPPGPGRPPPMGSRKLGAARRFLMSAPRAGLRPARPPRGGQGNLGRPCVSLRAPPDLPHSRQAPRGG